MSADKQTRKKGISFKIGANFRRLSKRFMRSLLRGLFAINKPTRATQSGFVLPTTALLLLVLTLTVGTLSFRTFSRSTNVIALREQQVIDNSAAPTIDRAKAKLEYLFSKDERFPGGVPSSDVLVSLMLNDGSNGIPANASNPYTFPDETRVDVNGGGVDNAWSFLSDVNGDGVVETDEVVVYSVLMDDENAGSQITDDQSDAKADALVTRNGPINAAQTGAGCSSDRAPEAGWEVVSTSKLQKNFQVTAFVANKSDVNRTASALEFQQVRQANRGNKWGAWFLYDLELFPGADEEFVWNGAMHTEGNLIAQDDYSAKMISSHKSCLYTQDASEITLATEDGYEGEILSAKTASNNFSSGAANATTFDIFTDNGVAPSTNVVFNHDNDSVKHRTGEPTGRLRKGLRNILLDPIKLFTEGQLAHRGTANWEEDSNWEGTSFASQKRIYNSPSVKPYLDDTYRADNRYGPKSGSDKGNIIPSGSVVGDAITGDVSLTALDPAGGVYGLDGYWERRAIGQGLRFIVGQRLELGNTDGWKKDEEKIYPPNKSTPTEVRQRRSLNDNLAAVQGMVVYHYESNGGSLPAACIASTAHPGTLASIIDSRTFDTRTVDGADKLDTDFFNGKGTNGFEFSFPYTTDAAFSAAIAIDQPLGKVLRNLSKFAGDPLGGAPSFEPIQDGNVHPAPYITAWGDFSNLRRIFASGTAYTSLSPADKSTLHSAACTVGMLSYSLNNEIQLPTADLGGLNSLGQQLEQLVDGQGNGGSADIDSYIGTNLGDSPGNNNHIPSDMMGQPVITSGAVSKADWNDTTDNSTGADARVGCTSDSEGVGAYNRVCDAADYYSQFSSEDFFRALLEQNALGSTLIDRMERAEALVKGSQFSRDRALGFKPGGMPSILPSSDNSPWDSETGLIGNSSGTGLVGSSSNAAQLISGCDPDIFNESDNANIGLSIAFCQDIEKDVKYPALYYLFPYFTHDHDGKDDSGTIYIDHSQPPAEEYIADAYAASKNKNGTDSDYLPVSNADILALGTDFSPKTDLSTWALPTPTASSVLSDPDTQPFTINISGSGSDVSVLDKAMYDGREAMSLRMLDIDIKKLTTDTNISDHWIADTDGIVYAFREDAVREDSIVRPKDSGTAWAACDEWNEVYENDNSDSKAPVKAKNENCRLKKLTSATALPFLQDPPLSDKKISTKPIDFYADPDRRPYGFRLLNGSTLNRADDVLSGMTFVSDNMVYIKGDFNLHTKASSGELGTTANTACADILEEFIKAQRLIGDDCSKSGIDFYAGRTTLNDSEFADPAVDKWRPVEIVGDAVGVLSNNFKDGSVEDTFVLEGGFSPDNAEGISSYQNQNRLHDRNAHAAGRFSVDRSGRVIDSIGGLPVGIQVPGVGVIPAGLSSPGPVPESNSNALGGMMKYGMSYGEYQKRRTAGLQDATRTIVNVVFISGIIPSQAGQSYGGMHNFPRFLEYWDTVDLHISGGFFQLNFSTSATGPYDPDAWEPGSNPINDDNDRAMFYGAPNRIWGYDVGLQYAPAGPIARRFVTVDRPRSEFYRELPVDDAYVKNLRCSVDAGGNRIYPNESSCS